MTNSGKRVLIFIVAYNAEKTIASVLSRIPLKDLPAGTEVLVIDDSSADRTVQAAEAHREVVAGMNLTVLSTPVNQGYGGNQKIGYQYAIEKGFDVVALVHGDGQYAPEKLPDLIAPILSGEADACFGSRMLERGAALKYGMPLYKYVGNKILTGFQNRMLRMRLSEFHSGYRIYSVEALKRVPFRYNTSDFHFDTEIIIQFQLAGLRIKELPIPTYYGDEICYVNGFAYAWHVVMATLASRLHGMGVFFQRKYDVTGIAQRYELKLGYRSSHTMAIGAVKEGASVLDIACGRGYVAAELRKKGCRVTGLDRQPADPGHVDTFIAHDLDSPHLPPGVQGPYDFILGLDCLEHLASPEGFLADLRSRCYSDKTQLVFTVPNIGFVPMRMGLFFGQFNYGREGILDLTHKRLFTFRSFRRMLEQEGYRVTALKGIPAPFPKAMGDGGFSRFLVTMNRALIGMWWTMFSYQIYAEATFLPPVDRLLVQTIQSASNGARKDNPPPRPA